MSVWAKCCESFWFVIQTTSLVKENGSWTKSQSWSMRADRKKNGGPNKRDRRQRLWYGDTIIVIINIMLLKKLLWTAFRRFDTRTFFKTKPKNACNRNLGIKQLSIQLTTSFHHFRFSLLIMSCLPIQTFTCSNFLQERKIAYYMGGNDDDGIMMIAMTSREGCKQRGRGDRGSRFLSLFFLRTSVSFPTYQIYFFVFG